MSTIKAIGGTLTHFGKKLALGITSSAANVSGPQVEVNVPPVWEGTDQDGSFNITTFPGDFLVYKQEMSPSVDGVLSTTEQNIGYDFRLDARAFISASDRNTGAQLTLTLISQSIQSGSDGTYNTQEIDLNDINVIFPDNATPGSTASLFIQTSSNFKINEDIKYTFEVQVKDQQGQISRVNNPSNSNHNSQHNAFFQLNISNTSESPFIITQSNDVSISSSTTINDHIGAMEFSLGNESSPDFSLIPTIFIKDRDRKANAESLVIRDIKNFGDGASSLVLYNGGLSSYVTSSSTGGSNLIFSSSNLVENHISASARYFHLDLDPDRLPIKLSAKNSPYKLTISASDGTSTKTSSSITLNITNENPTFSAITTSATASIQDINDDTKRPVTTKTYASASDPGDDNITLSQLSIEVDSGDGSTGTKGLNSNFFTTEFVNHNSITSSFRIVTSSNFPLNFNTTASKGNEIVRAIVRASDECSPAGTTEALGDTTGSLFIDAPPSWSAVAQTIASNENSVGSILSSNTYKTVFDDTTHIGTTNAGDVTLDTGSGFIINCTDPRLLGSHFIFTPTNAVNGNNATFSITTSSLYDRIDANASARLIITASDNRSQTAYHTFQVNITNIDEFIDVLGSDLLDELRAFFSVRVDGVTTQLANTVADISSPISAGSLSIVSGSQTNATISQSANYVPTTITSANGSTVDFDTIGTSTTATRIPGWSLDTLRTGATGGGTMLMWLKTGARSSLGVENDTIFGHDNAEGIFNFGSDGASSTDARLNVGGNTINVSRYFDTSQTYSGRDFHQIAVSWNRTNAGGTFKLYHNTTEIGETTTLADVTNGLRRGSFIGALGRTGLDTPSQEQTVNFSIFASFNKQLSSGEIRTVFNAFSGSHGL